MLARLLLQRYYVRPDIIMTKKETLMKARTCSDIYKQLETCKTLDEYMKYLESINVITGSGKQSNDDDTFNFGQRENNRDVVIVGNMVRHLTSIADSSQRKVVDDLYEKIYFIDEHTRFLISIGGPGGEKEDIIHTQIDRFIMFAQAVANKTYYKNPKDLSKSVNSSSSNIQSGALVANSFLGSKGAAQQQQDSTLSNAENNMNGLTNR
jgi:hypothetical protein